MPTSSQEVSVWSLATLTITQVMVGVRLMLGSQDISSIKLFGRAVHIMVMVRPRWVEFSFTREESVQCGKKLRS